MPLLVYLLILVIICSFIGKTRPFGRSRLTDKGAINGQFFLGVPPDSLQLLSVFLPQFTVHLQKYLQKILFSGKLALKLGHFGPQEAVRDIYAVLFETPGIHMVIKTGFILISSPIDGQ